MISFLPVEKTDHSPNWAHRNTPHSGLQSLGCSFSSTFPGGRGRFHRPEVSRVAPPCPPATTRGNALENLTCARAPVFSFLTGAVLPPTGSLHKHGKMREVFLDNRPGGGTMHLPFGAEREIWFLPQEGKSRAGCSGRIPRIPRYRSGRVPNLLEHPSTAQSKPLPVFILLRR